MELLKIQPEFIDRSFYSSAVVVSCTLGHEWGMPDAEFLLHSHMGTGENGKQKMLGSLDLGGYQAFTSPESIS